MKKGFVRLSGRKHATAKEFVEFFLSLEELVGPENVGTQPLRHVKTCVQVPEYEVKYYNIMMQVMKISAHYQKMIQPIMVKVVPTETEKVRSFVSSYNNSRKPIDKTEEFKMPEFSYDPLM